MMMSVMKVMMMMTDKYLVFFLSIMTFLVTSGLKLCLSRSRFLPVPVDGGVQPLPGRP